MPSSQQPDPTRMPDQDIKAPRFLASPINFSAQQSDRWLAEWGPGFGPGVEPRSDGSHIESVGRGVWVSAVGATRINRVVERSRLASNLCDGVRLFFRSLRTLERERQMMLLFLDRLIVAQGA